MLQMPSATQALLQRVPGTVILLPALVLLAGCLAGPASYETLTVDRGVAKFSLEYPAHYGWGLRQEISEERQVTHASVVSLYTSSILWIDVYGATELDPEAVLKDNLRMFSHEREFRIIKQGTITVAGLPAHQAAYQYLPAPIFGSEPSGLTVRREAVFKRGDVLWVISIGSPADAAGMTASEFEHILATLKFLD